MQLNREDPSEVWGITLQKDTHISHGHQIIWIAGVNPTGVAMKAQPTLKIGDIIHKMDEFYTDQIDYSKYLQDRNVIELTIIRQLEEKSEDDTFTSFFAKLFPSATDLSYQSVNRMNSTDAESTPLATKGVYSSYGGMSSVTTTMKTPSSPLVTAAAASDNVKNANEEYERSKRERERRLQKASSSASTPTITSVTTSTPASPSPAATKSALDEYEESKRERERRLKMKSFNATAFSDNIPTTDSTTSG